MNDKYGWNKSGKRIRDAIPSEVILTDDHRAILAASGHLIHANALVESQQEQIDRLSAKVRTLESELVHEKCPYSHMLADWCACGWKRDNEHEEHDHDHG